MHENIKFWKSVAEPFKNDLKCFDDAALERELSEATNKLQEQESWAEALSAERNLRAMRKALQDD